MTRADDKKNVQSNELPIEICGQILSFLPILPWFFKACRVCKAWKEQVERLLTSYEKELDRYHFHLHFGRCL